MRTIVIAKIVVLNAANEALLLTRGMDAPNRPGDLDFPGGHVEAGEDYAEAVCRELFEEAGLTIDPNNVTLYYGHTEVYKSVGIEGEIRNVNIVRLVFWTRLPTGDTRIQLSREHTAFHWTPVHQVPLVFPHHVFGISVKYALQHNLFEAGSKSNIVVKAIVLNSNHEALLLRRSSSDTDRPGDADFPGGGVDDKEGFKNAIIREAKEEAGLSIKPDSTQLFYAFTEMLKRGNATRLAFYTHVANETEVTLSSEHSDYRWVPDTHVSTVFSHYAWGPIANHLVDNHIAEDNA